MSRCTMSRRCAYASASDDLARQPQRIVHRQRALPLQPLPKRLALDVRHHVVEDAVRLARVVHRQDVRMAQLARDLHLAQEPLGAERRGQLGPHHLHRHPALVLLVHGEVHRRHARPRRGSAPPCSGRPAPRSPWPPRTRRCWPRAAAPPGQSGWRHRSACRTALRAAVGCCRQGRCVRWFSGCFQGRWGGAFLDREITRKVPTPATACSLFPVPRFPRYCTPPLTPCPNSG